MLLPDEATDEVVANAIDAKAASWFDKDRREGYARACPSRQEISMAKVKISPDDVVALPKSGAGCAWHRRRRRC